MCVESQATAVSRWVQEIQCVIFLLEWKSCSWFLKLFIYPSFYTSINKFCSSLCCHLVACESVHLGVIVVEKLWVLILFHFNITDIHLTLSSHLSAGCLFFLCLGLMYMFRPNMSFVAPVQEKVVIGMFFLGAILCLSFSWLFHTVYCHSEGVSRVFSK